MASQAAHQPVQFGVIFRWDHPRPKPSLDEERPTSFIGLVFLMPMNYFGLGLDGNIGDSSFCVSKDELRAIGMLPKSQGGGDCL